MSNKKRILITMLITLTMITGVITGLYVDKIINNKKHAKLKNAEVEDKADISIENMTDIEKRIAGIDLDEIEKEKRKKEIEEDNYSELYKEYLKLPKEEQEKSECIPRKEDVPFEKLEEIKEKLEKDDDKKTEEDNKEKKDDLKEDEEDNKKDETEVNDNDEEEIDNTEEKTDDEDKEQEEKIPEKFNLADVIDIKVGNQGGYGLCWDFASTKTLETYLALNNLGNYDFSELHVDYLTSSLLYGHRKLHNGGNFADYQNYLLLSGPVLEEQLPYRYELEKGQDYDTFVDMPTAVLVTETVDFPALYKSEYNVYTEEQIDEFRKTVKKHIMKNGALYTSTIGSLEKNFYASPDLQEAPNHAVVIVGWDDNYSKDNFVCSNGKKPSKDGAYICLNSWGNYMDTGGYFYISYEDKFVEANLSGILSTSLESAYKIEDIKNKELREHIKNHYSKFIVKYDGEDYITKLALSSIGELDLSNCNLSSLEGIEMFSNLNSLNASNNNIDDITPLSKLSNLLFVDLSNNNITDVSAFGNMKNKKISDINLSNNKIKDVSAIGEIQYEYDWNTLQLNISNNPNVKGIENLKNVTYLDISDCNIKDVSAFKDFDRLDYLKINNTPGIKGLSELPGGLYELEISNCDLDNLSEINNNISSLKISNNNIVTLEELKDFHNLYNLDVSGNSINDWSSLKEIVEVKNNEEDDYNLMGRKMSIIANNCNIEDITVFNDCYIGVLELQNNKIKDVSQFDNEYTFEIDLSGNTDLIGLEGLSKIDTVFLNNCNFSDMSEIGKLTMVSNLSLENNNLTDIDGFSDLLSIYNLSLAGNKGIKGTISNNSIMNLNVSNCDIDDSFDFSKMTELTYLNIKNNARIKNIPRIILAREGYIRIMADEAEYEEIELINNNDEYIKIYFQDTTLYLNKKLDENEKVINIKYNESLKNELRKSYIMGKINVVNGKLNKNCCEIEIEDTSKDYVEIEIEGWSSRYINSTIKIIINPSLMREKNYDEINDYYDELHTYYNSISNNSTDNGTTNYSNTYWRNNIIENNTIHTNTTNEYNTTNIIYNNDITNYIEEFNNTSTNEIDNSINLVSNNTTISPGSWRNNIGPNVVTINNINNGVYNNYD